MPAGTPVRFYSILDELKKRIGGVRTLGNDGKMPSRE
jgi:hypothetical protein